MGKSIRKKAGWYGVILFGVLLFAAVLISGCQGPAGPEAPPDQGPPGPVTLRRSKGYEGDPYRAPGDPARGFQYEP